MVRLNCEDVDEYLILLGFFRYCLGRQTYIVPVAVESIKQSWGSMNSYQKSLFKKEIREAIEGGWAGSELIDVPGWKTILDLEV